MRSLPRVVSNIPSDLRNFLDRVREYLGEGSDNRFVTLGELKKGGIVGVTPGGSIVPPGEYGVQDPAMPRNLTATGAFAVIFLEWDPPNYLGHSHTEVWAADTDDFTTKILVGTTEANSYGHEIGTGATKYYWIRFVNTLGTVGAFNGTAGTLGATSENPDYLIDVLSDAYGVTGDAPFFQIDTPTVINGVTIPAGTYIKQAWIADATISRAKIQDLAVDNAKINDLNVSKLTTGVLQVGATISSQGYVAGTSGWRINANGTAEFSSITARGSIFASGGTIGGATIASSYVQSTNYTAGSAGWKLNNADGSAEFRSVTISGTVTGSTILGGNATGYDSNVTLTRGDGFFAGFDSGVYKWRVGDVTAATDPKYVRWTGTNLEISQSLTDIINTPNLTTNSMSQVYVGTAANILSVTAQPTDPMIATSNVVVPNGSTGVLVIHTCSYDNQTGSDATAGWAIRRNGSYITGATGYGATLYTVDVKAGSRIAVTRAFFDDSVTQGTHTYQIYAYTTWTTGANISLTDQTLTCIPLKR